MSVIYYQRRRGALECERISETKGEELKIRFGENFKGAVKLGSLLKKIDGNCCIFDTGCLKDGIYKPEIHLSGVVIEAEEFEISNGKIKLVPIKDAFIRELSRELEAQRREIAAIKEKLRAYDEKINGNPIF